MANHTAGDVLGCSLDDLPPQTRRVLAALDAWVTEQAGTQGIERTAVRFTRRTVRGVLGLSDTQLRVHLERLVALHDERVEEEKRGIVRWLRPEYQIPRFGKDLNAPAPELALPEADAEDAVPAERARWPATAVEQIAALLAHVSATPATPDEAAAAFEGAKPALVRRHLETLVLVGELREGDDGRFEPVPEPA